MNKIIQGDALAVLKTLDSESIDMVMTSPPYWALRDYGVDGQLGLEPTFQEYINKLCDIFDEVKRVLKPEGTCWVNIGDTYSGNKEGKTDNKVSSYLKNESKGIKKKATIKEKCLCQIPSRFAIEMTNRGWILRNEIIWYKRNCMPSSVKDRFTVDFEKIFFFSKNKNYYFKTQYEKFQSKPDDINKKRNKGAENFAKKAGGKLGPQISEGIRDWYKYGERNKRCVWTINTKGYKEAHFAVYPEELCITPIKAGCPPKGIVLDIFFGAGTTGKVAQDLGRNYLGIELNSKYIKIAEERLRQKSLL